VNTQEFDKLKIPKSAVFCKRGVSIPPGAYLGMAKGVGKDELIMVEGGHEMPFTNPKVVADGLPQTVK
jgi:hypothetical protein